MTVIKMWSLYCDHPDCETAGAWNGDLRDGTARLLRTEARRAGWTQRGSKDYCAEHSVPPSPSQGGGTDG